MCWDWVECKVCFEKIVCTAVCGCDKPGGKQCRAWGHQDCKEFYGCDDCSDEICDTCYECDVTVFGSKHYCQYCYDRLHE
jgi:hypothetical protein